MRARLLTAWPDLAMFGVTPLNFDLLTVPELRQYLDAIDELRKRR